MNHAPALLALLLIFASAMLVEGAGKISYQVPRADRIAIGTVTDVQSFYDHTIVTIEVDDWLRSPLPKSDNRQDRVRNRRLDRG